MKIKITIIILLIVLIKNNGNCQNNFSFDINVGTKIPIIEGKGVNDIRKNCYNVSRKNSKRFNKNPLFAKFLINHKIARNINIGLEAEINFIKNEKFKYFQHPAIRDVKYFPIRISLENKIFEEKFGKLILKNAFGIVLGKTVIYENLVEEEGKFTFITGFKFEFSGILKGLYINIEYELQRDETLFDVNKLFNLQRNHCEIYRYNYNRNYLNLGLGISF